MLAPSPATVSGNGGRPSALASASSASPEVDAIADKTPWSGSISLGYARLDSLESGGPKKGIDYVSAGYCIDASASQGHDACCTGRVLSHAWRSIGRLVSTGQSETRANANRGTYSERQEVTPSHTPDLVSPSAVSAPNTTPSTATWRHTRVPVTAKHHTLRQCQMQCKATMDNMGGLPWSA